MFDVQGHFSIHCKAEVGKYKDIQICKKCDSFAVSLYTQNKSVPNILTFKEVHSMQL